MSNESFAQVPLDLTNADALRRFLQKVVEEVDVITGRRAADLYVKTSEVEEAEVVSLTELSNTITEIEKILAVNATNIATNESDIATLQADVDALQFITTHAALTATYNDFDNAVWGTLKGKGQFSALGSAMTNPPFAVTAGTTYLVYADSATTTGGGVTQRVMMEDTGVDLKVFYRTGDSFAQAVTNGWTQL